MLIFKPSMIFIGFAMVSVGVCSVDQYRPSEITGSDIYGGEGGATVTCSEPLETDVLACDKCVGQEAHRKCAEPRYDWLCSKVDEDIPHPGADPACQAKSVICGGPMQKYLDEDCTVLAPNAPIQSCGARYVAAVAVDPVPKNCAALPPGGPGPM